VGENNQALQMQEGNGNRSVIWQDTQLGSQATTQQSGQRNDATIEQLFGGSNNRSLINQSGNDNQAAAEHLTHQDGDIAIYQQAGKLGLR
jgi:hypothetical protein